MAYFVDINVWKMPSVRVFLTTFHAAIIASSLKSILPNIVLASRMLQSSFLSSV